MGKIKYILILIVGVAALCAGSYLYLEGDKAVKNATVEAQTKTTMVDAVNVLEDHKNENGIKFSMSRKYELPTQTLWELTAYKYFATETCSILEEHPEVNLKVDSQRYEEVINFLNSNGIEYVEVK